MSSPKVLFGFHAVGVRLKTAPQSIIEVYYEATRRDARMRQFLARAKEAGVRLIEAEHLCMAMRGVRKAGAITTTSAVRGQFKTDNASRAEALELILRR